MTHRPARCSARRFDAELTITFHAAKPGLWIAPGKDHAGEVEVVPIGIGADAPVVPRLGLIDAAVLDQVPRRGRESTKFAAGAVLVCGGSLGLTGAPCLASESAQRAGAGYVTALIPASLNLVFEQRLLEAMSVPLPDEDGALQPGGLDEILTRCERAGALALGPGIGRARPTQELVRAVAARAPIPLLLDADGLFAYSGRLSELADRGAATVLTPHAGELGRLLERDSTEIDAHRLSAVREAAAAAQAIVVLKGDDTIVCAPDGRAAISRGGAAALATAGTGDVLSGVIGAYLSKRMDAFTAACAGVFVHARAGQLAAAEIGARGRDRQRRDRAAAARPGGGGRADGGRGASADGAGAGTGQPRRDRAQRRAAESGVERRRAAVRGRQGRRLRSRRRGRRARGARRRRDDAGGRRRGRGRAAARRGDRGAVAGAGRAQRRRAAGGARVPAPRSSPGTSGSSTS